MSEKESNTEEILRQACMSVGVPPEGIPVFLRYFFKVHVELFDRAEAQTEGEEDGDA